MFLRCLTKPAGRLLTVLVAVLALDSLHAEEPPHGGYPDQLIQVTQGPGPKEERLRMPIATYADEQGRMVDLLGAVHMADAPYYRFLNRRFTGYDKLLYEMVNGELLAETLLLRKKVQSGKASAQEKARYDELARRMKEESSVLGKLLGGYYAQISETLGLSTQGDIIDYGMPNFVFADLSQEEFAAAMAERGESWLGYLTDSMSSADGGFAGSLRMAQTMQSRSVVEKRRMLMHLIAKSDVGSMGDDSAIIAARNERCMEVLDRVLTDVAVRKVGIFYGAAHLRDMHARLLERGFVLQGVRWVTAWKVGSKLK